MKKIYLDYASSTPLDPKVLKEMMPFLKKEHGNPSSLHSWGQKTKAAIEQARVKVAKLLNCAPLEVVFTSGATEANNLAVRGVVGYARGFSQKPLHVVVSSIEHESLLAVVQELESQGAIEATYIKPNAEGIVSAKDVMAAVGANTILVSIMYANSEIGTVQPIAEIGSQLELFRKEHPDQKLYFHTDAVQAVQFLDCSVEKLKVDMMTISSHKIYGPKGAGALYIKEGTLLDPLVIGGGQEQNMRSGTENVPAFVGMGKAAEGIAHPHTNIANIKMRQLRDKLIKDILAKIPKSALTGSPGKRLANNIHVCFEGIEGKELVTVLDGKGIAVSTGSACSEKTQDPSHVLLSLGKSPKEAASCIRITLGKYTAKEEVQKFLKI
ncbi:MAG: cysteine desulfurase, partial [Candidatus Wildermuthbacteria bacterium]|nr:cysteine desulfurase [Candidatus Wildermuthbacteria bacterium]